MATKRVRLTDPRRASRGRRAVEDPSIPYPGTVNQPDRTFKRRDQYNIDWETVNHPYPDMRTEWKNNPRDEIGFGIPDASGPTVASVKVAASKAVRMAVLLLGEKVADDVIEDQARDLMAIGPDAMDRSLERFVESQELYVAEDKEDDKEEDGKEASAALADKNSAVPAAIAEPKKAEDDDDDEERREAAIRAKVDEIRTERAAAAQAEEEAIVAEATARLDAEDKKDDGESKGDESKSDLDYEGDKKAADDGESKGDESKSDLDYEGDKKAADDEDDDDDEDGKEASAPAPAPEAIQIVEELAPAPLTGPNEMDIELTSASSMDDIEPDPEADARLAQCFEDESIPKEGAEAVEAQPRVAKTGIKELGGQPRAMTAGQGDAPNLSQIWETAPDLTSLFR
jgi:hypothetical protein